MGFNIERDAPEGGATDVFTSVRRRAKEEFHSREKSTKRNEN
jgi:hypothetical protein